ncbi:phosphotransferase [Photobacterium jeanii]|uniref:Phosphotransferase n=1 Tax=Photobacterium jeanii TaxID=858640 RepID=A0A178K2K2_9GAMM|nr:phosphotransferase [Photobacterium jeanii]OAN11539.1 phosphotransferase [Photobacterium jeanii]PST91058.1 phosphotransferase [Photobacterium jeanii]
MNERQLERIACETYKILFGVSASFVQTELTFYGCVVFLASERQKVVIKFSKEVGRLTKEINGLERLAKIVDCPVPAIHFYGQQEGFDYLVLEWLDGQSAHELPLDKTATTTFSEHYTDILLALHECSHEQGFETSPQCFTPSLNEAFEHWMEPVYRYLMSAASPFSAQLKDDYQALWEQQTDILAPINHGSSLVHDDCHIGNVLFDPKTYRVSALIDPCDVGFKHREFDIFHLYDVRPDLGLADVYFSKTEKADGFEQRRWFLSLWDDAKHSRNIGWYDEAWLNHKFDNYRQECA